MRESLTKSRGQIARENVFTLFNFLNFLIAGLLAAVGAWSNMLFIAIILLNIVIGIAQEWKAKKLVDGLSILNRPRVRVCRDGGEVMADLSEVQKGDLIVLESGDQICNDSVLVEGSLEVDESLLTGESDAVIRDEGDGLLSGSFVLAGKAYARVIHAGNDNYVTKLAGEVKREKRVRSELLDSMRKVTRFTSFLILPAGILLVLEALLLRHAPAKDAIVSSAAALLGMLPKGLVLLISVSLASGVIRLAKMKILVQNIYALETLARVDTLCLDKTGTVTDGNLTVRDVYPLGDLPQEDAKRLIESYVAACGDHNATFFALRAHFSGRATDRPVHSIPFSSKRKWGCVSFLGKGSVFVGAPEKILDRIPEHVERELERGYRAVAMGYAPVEWKEEGELPEGIQPLCAVILEDRIRPCARETLDFFRKEGVDVKMISGDHIDTVSWIAKRAGLERWKDALDLSREKDVDYDAICQKYAVFARVTPEQKRELVQALKRNGRCVAMTGDGVNDLLAIREADCSIAMADGSDASRQISQVVLLDSDFTSLPQVVMEGRKAIHHVTRTAGVFFIKTVYSVLLSLFCLLAGREFPFIPIQITLVDACIEAYPSFFTILESNTSRIRGRFLTEALSHAAPFGAAVAAAVALLMLWAPFSPQERGTVMYLLLILISMAAVVKSCLPFTALRAFLCVTMGLGIAAACVLLPGLFGVAGISGEMAVCLLVSAAVSAALIALLERAESRLSEIRHLDGKRLL